MFQKLVDSPAKQRLHVTSESLSSLLVSVQSRFVGRHKFTDFLAHNLHTPVKTNQIAA